MFELVAFSPSRPTLRPTRADTVLLRPVDPPQADALWSTSVRTVLLAAPGDRWVQARVLAWTWNPTGKPVVWRCAVDLGGRVGWFAYDARLLRPLVPGPEAR